MDAVSRLSGLQRLSITSVDEFSCDQLSNLTSLRDLKISAALITEWSSVAALSELRKLAIHSTITDTTPLVHLNQLEKLDISPASDGCLLELARISSLSSLTLQSTNVTGAGLAGFSALRKLCFRFRKLGNDGLVTLGTLTNLQELFIYIFDLELDYSSLNLLTNLRTLEMNGKSIEDSLICSFTSLVNLEKVVIHNSRNITDLSMRALAVSPRLCFLQFISKGVTDEGVCFLSNLTTLRSQKSGFHGRGLGKLACLQNLSLGSCYNIDRNLQFITNLTRLAKLRCTDILVYDEGFHNIAKLMQLRTLKIQSEDITSTMLTSLSDSLMCLTKLRLHECRAESYAMIGSMTSLTKLMLFNTTITDNCICAFTTLSQLRVLDLNKNSFLTDLSLKAIASLFRLDYLGLCDVGGWTERGLEQLLPSLVCLQQLCINEWPWNFCTKLRKEYPEILI